MTHIDEKEIEVTITGKVQGVNFRKFAKKHAEELGLSGYVQNTSDGEVEVVAQGGEELLEQFVALLKKGPHFAEIDDVGVAWHDTLQDTFTDFSIKETL